MKKSIKVYHNPRCSKSRMALAYLNDKGIEYAVTEYLKDNPSKEELKAILVKLNISAIELVRKNEEIFKSKFKDQDLTDDQWIEAMLEYPQLIERPIVILGENAVIARPTEKIDELLK